VFEKPSNGGQPAPACVRFSADFSATFTPNYSSPLLSLPEIFERRRAQSRLARRVLDRAVAEPILDAPRVVAGARQA